MGDSLWLDFPANISDIASQNDSFDTCKIWVLYAGESRNKTTMTKEVVESAIPSLFNVPIVCHYNIDDDTIGGHDVTIVHRDDDSMKLVNLTDAVGVIPYGAEHRWEVNENDGREYLTVDGLLWKRAAAYDKIKSDGVEAQSMEINVKDGKREGDLYKIDSFSFTALCLLGDGVEPCFENASLTFSLQECKDTCEKMFAEYAQAYKMTSTTEVVDDIDNSEKGGEEIMQEEEKKVFSDPVDQTAQEDPEEEENTNTTTENQNSQQTNTDDADSDITVIGDGKNRKYSLSVSQIQTEVEAILGEHVEYDEDFGCKRRKYWMHDFDVEKMELYVEDTKGYRLYALPFTIDGDKVNVDFACARRVKVVYETIEDDCECKDAQFSVANAYGEALNELKSLREFKLAKDNEARKSAESEVFSRFADLESNDDFNKLRNNCGDLSIEQIEEKCFAIRGRSLVIKFSAEENAPVRTPIEKINSVRDNEPYGGLFVEFANK